MSRLDKKVADASVYILYFGDEAAQTILENLGLVAGGGDQSTNIKKLSCLQW